MSSTYRVVVCGRGTQTTPETTAQAIKVEDNLNEPPPQTLSEESNISATESEGLESARELDSNVGLHA